MSELITCGSAREILNAQRFDYGDEILALTQVLGKVLAEPIVADRDQPPFDRVAMDGIAIHYPAYAAGQRFFGREGVQAAGQPAKPLFGVNRCIEVMTGAALPGGCTTVIRYEDLEEEGGGFHAPEGIKDNQNIHPRGKDAQAGEELAPAGRLIGVPEIGMLASCGYAKVRVRTIPRIAVITTGDELVPPGEKPAEHQIRMSNLYQLNELLGKNGFTVASGMHVIDDPSALHEILGQCIEEHDVIILTGGVSKGKFDYVPDVLSELGIERLFHGVAQRPGKPLWIGRNADTMVFGLPGNPQSSLSCCLAYVLPFLHRQIGLEANKQFAKLARDVAFKPDLTLFAYVAVSSDAQTGELLATPVKHAGSGDASSLLRGNAFMELPQGQSVYRAGEVYEVRYL
ncbi:molybdopterin molybdotransferase MoeA [Lewinella sp. 4G2]|uniref:molybdopterin molybdotransferase MoeA n=1 Tax=Lewinella sp. 4G2 TaxID=1803372 RepID=UPI0007DED935|nr:molybdopterin molybdotransferase MoeA [Lewinella sp. 4G2]OAV44651.1 hypothetical protein A3850_009170 [Lewinella sp. 4G2]